MAKASFTALEESIWHSVYGPSHGPTSGRVKIIVEEFASRGLVPVMMRLEDRMLPFAMQDFIVALQGAMFDMADDRVQVFYHPAECEKVVGSSATTWTQWGQLILNRQGLLSGPSDDLDPILQDNVPRVRLPDACRRALSDRGVLTSTACRLLSLRMVVFFIAAQYEAWATPAEVSQVTPFKRVLQTLNYQCREVVVRKDDGLQAIIDELDDEPQVTNTYGSNYPIEFEYPAGMKALAMTDQALESIQPETTESPVPEMDAIDEEIYRMERKLQELRRLKEESSFKKKLLQAKVSDVDIRDGQMVVVLELSDGSLFICANVVGPLPPHSDW